MQRTGQSDTISSAVLLQTRLQRLASLPALSPQHTGHASACGVGALGCHAFLARAIVARPSLGVLPPDPPRLTWPCFLGVGLEVSAFFVARSSGPAHVHNLPRVRRRCARIAMKRSRTSSGHGTLAPHGAAGGPSPSAESIMRYPHSDCPACGCELHPYAQEVVTAAVLDVSGWKTMFHEPLRCRHSTCALRRKRIWHNFIAMTASAHEWVWPSGRNMQCFFLCSGLGVTTAWLRQMSRRLVHHYASFSGEAAVHLAEGGSF